MCAIAHASRLEREHAPQLAAAQDADCGARQLMRFTGACPAVVHRHGTGAAARATGAATRENTPASSPAFFAPGLPIASVPGTGSICTIDNSESSPCSAALCTGTPSTGSTRVRRHHARQVRRAAGPGDDQFDATALGALREFGHPHRRAMRGDDLLLEGHVELFEDLGRVTHRVPVGRGSHDDGD